MNGTRVDDLGDKLARELQRSAAARPIDLLDAQSNLQIRLDRGRRNLAVAGIAAVTVLIACTAVLFAAQQRQESQVINPRPSTEVTVTVVSRASEPRGPEDFEWPLLQAVRTSPVASFVGWEAATSYTDGPRALDTAAGRAAVVLVSGPDLQDYIPQVVANHPETVFVVMDGTAAVPGAHVVDLGAEQAAFLAGALAASITRTGMLGAVFGARLETTEALAAGFVAGAREVSPDIPVDVRYLTAHPDLSGFGNISGQETSAEQMFAAGADVVYGDAAIAVAARLAADGVQRWAIGVDVDRRASAAPGEAPVVLTSVLKDLSGATSEILELLSTDGFDGDLVLGLASGRTGLGEQAPEAAPYTDLLADLQAQISAGDITVPVTGP